MTEEIPNSDIPREGNIKEIQEDNRILGGEKLMP